VEEAHANYAAAARYSTAYYGQLARAKLGLGDVALHEPAQPGRIDRANIAALESGTRRELLYSIGERNLAVRFVAALGERSDDVTALAAAAEVTVDHEDPQATLLIGKAALARGLDLVPYAFPTLGLPQYKPMGPKSIRASSTPSCGPRAGSIRVMFRPQTPSDSCRSHRKRGETPRSGSVALRLDANDLRSGLQHPDGCGRARGLMRDYRGSFLLTFAGYNAGRGRVEKWVAQYGDPRHPTSIPSTGSNASRLPKPATMSSV